MYRDIAHAVYKRGETTMEGYEIPSWAWGLILLNFLVFIPLCLMLNYTFQNVFPVLAMVEDPSPPAYEPVSLNDDGQSIAEETVPKLANERGNHETRAVTASFRDTYRTLYSISGWVSLFRGLSCWIATSFATALVIGLLTSVLPGLIAAPVAAIVLVQLYTAWVHIVISAPSPKSFLRRLPPFKKAFQATALPVAIFLFAWEVTNFTPKLVARALGLTQWNPSDPTNVPQADANDVWKTLVVVVIALVLKVFVMIPAQVVLVRIQASLLPEEDETIVAFDRSFQGKLEPAIVGGKGFVTIKDAWTTFSRASWTRLVKLYVKVFFVGIGFTFAWAIILVPEVLLIMRFSKKIE